MEENLPQSVDIPDQLCAHEQWICWRFQQRNDKRTKVPVNPDNGSFGSTTNPDSWTDFETALEYALHGAADGIGFVFTADDPFVGIDLDDCRVPKMGTLTDDASEVVETLASYTEVSPSGTGVHVIITGSLPGDRNLQEWVELYEESRFFTVTGDHVDGTPVAIEARPSALESVYATHVAGPTVQSDVNGESESVSTTSAGRDADTVTDDSNRSSGPDSGGENHLSDDDVIERARTAANSEKFTRLWRGQTTGYESQSEADMALCGLLAFWTGGESGQMDRLFRESGLMREKWDERHFADGSTYGERTIDRVLAGTDEFYDPDPAASPSLQSTPTDGDKQVDNSSPGTAALDGEIAEFTAREKRHLSVISDLQTQVERLEAGNKRLKEELASTPVDETVGQSEASERGHSILSRLRRWIRLRQ